MAKLNYEVLKNSGYDGYILEDAPVKVLQFGEGNFLRAFVDYWFDMSNEKVGWNGKVALVQPIAQGLTKLINEQEGLYTLYLRGSENGEKINRKRVISVVDACYNPYEAEDWAKIIEIAKSDDLEYIASNTTEAGIVYDPQSTMEQTPPNSFPAKLTVLLYERFKAGKKGVVILSCELIDANGKELEKCVKQHIADWGLGEDFAKWIEEENLFCSTLVDRIVPGRIRDPKEVAELEKENGYEDPLLVVGEVFGVWYIEGPEWLEEKLPFKASGLNVHVVPDVIPYKKRKVRILNGAHTGFVLGCDAFAAAVTDRFNNPFVDHQLMSISLNSSSKWRARNMPSFLEYIEKFDKLPEALTMSLAAYIAFYSNDIQRLDETGLVCKRPAGNEYTVNDDAWVLQFYYDHKDADAKTLVHDVLTNEKMWGQDLTQIEGLEDKVVEDLQLIREQGAEAAYASVL